MGMAGFFEKKVKIKNKGQKLGSQKARKLESLKAGRPGG
jgi:hypothetical protein